MKKINGQHLTLMLYFLRTQTVRWLGTPQDLICFPIAREDSRGFSPDPTERPIQFLDSWFGSHTRKWTWPSNHLSRAAGNCCHRQTPHDGAVAPVDTVLTPIAENHLVQQRLLDRLSWRLVTVRGSHNLESDCLLNPDACELKLRARPSGPSCLLPEG